ncbi:MAG TPA: endonuclease MutS2 [Acidobacteriaceae bacterium]|jgi:DNA mismatch repair protein MutS2|nr:endonuclease MutS2 [Acidobacteriaceae bacterium]
MLMLPIVPSPLEKTSAEMLGFPLLLDLVASYASTPVGRAWVQALKPTTDAAWAQSEQQHVEEIRRLLVTGGSFDFHGLFDPTPYLEQATIPGAMLAADEIRALVILVERVAAWQKLILGIPGNAGENLGGPLTEVQRLSEPLQQGRFNHLLSAVEGKIEPDGSIADTASPELGRIRRQMERQQRHIEESLRTTLRRMGESGSLQEELITIRGERFVIPVKAEWKRRIPGVVHGASSSGQTVFVEPLETIEQNNELQRLLEEEQAEIQRILAEITRAIATHAEAIATGAAILAEVESLFARARFAAEFSCVAPVFSPSTAAAKISLEAARHPLLEKRLRATGGRVVPLDLELGMEARQLIVSGPNTGGKTVALKTVGLLALMAQSGIPIPAEAALLPVFDAVLADIGDTQSIEQNLSTFSAHITRLDQIAQQATDASLVLLDELGSATDPEEGAALAAAIAEHFLRLRAWCLISTHHTSLKVYAANTVGVQNASAGFDEQTLAPTYQIRIGVPGASAGINIAQRIGLNTEIIASARQRLGSQTEEVSRFLDHLHVDLLAVSNERNQLRLREQEVARERNRLEVEGRNEQRLKVRALEDKLVSLLKDFDYQVKEMLRGIEDRGLQQKVGKDAERRMAKLRREFREQFDMTVVAHQSGADQGDTNAQPHIVREVNVGDTVKLRSLGKAAVVQRQVDAENFEVTAGIMKMRVRRDDIAEVLASASQRQQATSPLESARRKGISVSLHHPDTAISMEINVIGHTVDEATDAIEKFLDRAFLDGLPRIRIVHGSGLGVLRKALRAYLKSHPHVAGLSEPPQNEGGAGATVVELRQ